MKQDIPEDTTSSVSSPTWGLRIEMKVRKLRGAVKIGILKGNGSQERQNGWKDRMADRDESDERS